MTEYDESAFMADLLLGSGTGRCFGARAPQHFNDDAADQRDQTLQTLEQIVDRLRAQTIHIVAAYRGWKLQYVGESDALRRRYLRYEGALCKQDLIQHWTLYRWAVAEFSALRGRAPVVGTAQRNSL